MASSRDVEEFVRRLEGQVVREIDGRDRMALAYSGGLASTLVAMVARKRCTLECIVAGVGVSADVEASRAAKAHLDYRIRLVKLGYTDAARIRKRIATAHPRLRRREVDDLVPLFAVRECTRGPILSGFGQKALSRDLIAALRSADVRSPVPASDPESPTRRTLRDAATFLGLPETWARVAHRAPAEGSGLRETFRGLNRNRCSRKFTQSRS